MQKDDLLEGIRERFVRPFYLALLHGNLRRRDADLAVDLPARIGEAAKAIADPELATLLEEREWRGRLAAAWFIGITQRRGFVDAIGRLLLASELTYAGQGYCVALGLIAEPSCEEYLRSYLGLYLPPRGRFYDQTRGRWCPRAHSTKATRRIPRAHTLGRYRWRTRSRRWHQRLRQSRRLPGGTRRGCCPTRPLKRPAASLAFGSVARPQLNGSIVGRAREDRAYVVFALSGEGCFGW